MNLIFVFGVSFIFRSELQTAGETHTHTQHVHIAEKKKKNNNKIIIALVRSCFTLISSARPLDHRSICQFTAIAIIIILSSSIIIIIRSIQFNFNKKQLILDGKELKNEIELFLISDYYIYFFFPPYLLMINMWEVAERLGNEWFHNNNGFALEYTLHNNSHTFFTLSKHSNVCVCVFVLGMKHHHFVKLKWWTLSGHWTLNIILQYTYSAHIYNVLILKRFLRTSIHAQFYSRIHLRFYSFLPFSCWVLMRSIEKWP